ncbi:MAG: Wzt carbohydrate-binding domain-containing protein, partial [Chlorobium sp.]|nr:Wzt carbohydrate-binding domain-containing protein [Chlorobium sp.]
VDTYRNWSDSINNALIKVGHVDSESSTERLGISQVRLASINNEDCLSFIHGSPAKLEIKIQNRQIKEHTRARVGFSVRNNRGIEIFGSNTDVMQFDLRFPLQILSLICHYLRRGNTPSVSRLTRLTNVKMP